MSILLMMALAGAIVAFPRVLKEQEKRQQINENMEKFRSYAAKEPESFYYLDAYSSVYFTEKMFAGDTNSRKNYDILGGWVCHSPLQKGITEEYGKQPGLTIAEALLQDNFYLVIQQDRTISPITAWYESTDNPVEAEPMDTLGQGGKALCVYRLKRED